MRLRLLAAALLTVGLTPAAFAQTPSPDPAHPTGINARQQRQAARIAHGVQDGQITAAERNRLRGDEAATRAEERVYRRSGGGLSPAERRDLQRDLNHTSREIHRDAHNARTRG